MTILVMILADNNFTFALCDVCLLQFKRMLNKELSQFAESSKAGNQISEYISCTFLGKKDGSFYRYAVLTTVTRLRFVRRAISVRLPIATKGSRAALESQSHSIIPQK